MPEPVCEPLAAFAHRAGTPDASEGESVAGVGIYATRESLAVRAARALSAPPELLTTDRARVEEALFRLDCLVAIHPDLDPAFRAWLGPLQRRHPMTSLILVTHRDPDAARAATELWPERIVWLSELESRLGPVLEEIRPTEILERWGGAAKGASHLSSRLRRALAIALTATPPVLHARVLARRAGCSYWELWSDWRDGGGADGAGGIKDLLSRILLVRAASRKTEDRTWEDVARDLDVSPRTLWRTARRVSGRPLDEAAGDPSGLVAEVREALLPLCRES